MEQKDCSQCRVCLEQGGTVPIFETKDSVDPAVYRKLCQCLGEKIEDILGYPRHICRLCHITLNTAIRFIEQYKESQQILLKQVTRIKIELDDDNDADFDFEPFNENSIFIDAKPKSVVSDVNIEKQRCRNRIYKANKKNTKSVSNGALISKENKIKRSKPHTPTEKSYTKEIKESVSRSSNTVGSKEEGNCQPQPVLKSSSNEQSSSRLCDMCGEVFANGHHLYMHKISFHREYTCPQCPENSRKYSKRSLNEHIKITHSEERPHVCTLCGKAFKVRKILTDHIRGVHEGKRFYKKQLIKCLVCDRELVGKQCFEMHMRKHTGERPEICSVCGKAFPHKQYLTSHMRLHTGEKPYKCPVCNMAYAQHCNMKSHIKHNHKLSDLSEEMIETLSKAKINYLRFMKP